MSPLGDTLNTNTQFGGVALGAHPNTDSYGGTPLGQVLSTAAYPVSSVNEGIINTLDQWPDGSQTYVDNVANHPFYLDKIDRSLTYVNHSWFDGDWRYADIAAIYNNNYPGQSGASPGSANPTYAAMILKDASNNKLFIPYGATSGGEKTQYAADPGLAAWRSDYQSRITGILTGTNGAVGVMMDDVNPSGVNTSDGNGNSVPAIDPRTGIAMTVADWRRYLAESVEANKTTAGSYEIVSNMHWPSGNSGFTRGYNDQYIARIIDASDFILLENPLPGMTGDNDVAWTFSFAAFREFIDFCHSKNTNIAWFTYQHTDREYELAMYFLFSNGKDYVGVISNQTGNPATYNAMYDFDLGPALTGRFQVSMGGVTVWRRNFTNGFVVVNGPGMGTVTNADLGGSFLNTAGATVTTLASLPNTRGAIFRNP